MRKGKFWALLVMALLCLVGCEKDSVQEEIVPQKPTVLTHVYQGEAITWDDEYAMQSYWGVEDDNMVFLMRYFRDENVGTEDYTSTSGYAICHVPLDGTAPTYTDIEGIEYGGKLTPIEGGYVILDSTWHGTTFSYTYDLQVLKDGEETKILENLVQFFPGVNEEELYITQIIQDGAGYLYLVSESQIAVLDTDFHLFGTIHIDPDLLVTGVDKNTDGQVYLNCEIYTDNGYVSSFVSVDVENLQLGKAVTLPETVQADGCFFGDGYDLYYYNSRGIYGYNTGEADGTLLMDFENSDLSVGIQMVYAVGEDRFLLRYTDYTVWENRLELFHPVDDIDLSQITVLELAAVGDTTDLPTLVANFNRSHKELRIVTTDYSRYDTTEAPDGGNTRLANDILNGLYQPDILFGRYTDKAMQVVLQNEQYVDLKPYLETDTELPLSDLLGCVTNTYQEDGKMYALPYALEMEAVIANKSIVGDRDGWTIDELLDFLETTDTSYMFGMTQANGIEMLLGKSGYGSFLNLTEGTCDFTNDTFVRLLEWVKTLPTDAPTADETDIFAPYRTGETAAVLGNYTMLYGFLQEKLYFGEGNVAYVGYPTVDGTGGITPSADNQLMCILADTENPNEAWTFVKESILTSSEMMVSGSVRSLPMLRSTLPQLKEKYADMFFSIRNDGGASWSTMDPRQWGMEDGEVFQLTDADWAHIEDFLDNTGSPLSGAVLPEEVSAILAEEISGYITGTKSAEDCADMIQNRVSLYLAENS